MSAGLDRELAHLRARAYGPDADIHADPPALARLREIEQQQRPPARGADDPMTPNADDRASPTASPAFPRTASPATAQPVPPPAAQAVPAAAAVPQDADDGAPVTPLVAPVSLASSPPAAVLGRRTRMAWAASLVAAIVLSAGLAVWLFPLGVRDDRHHDARMLPQDSEVPRSVVTQFRSLGTEDVPRDIEVRSFGDYYGLGIYASGDCLLAVVAQAESMMQMACMADLALIMDVYVPSAADQDRYGAVGYPDELTGRFPDGGMVRFSFTGDEVLVDEGRVPDTP